MKYIRVTGDGGAVQTAMRWGFVCVLPLILVSVFSPDSRCSEETTFELRGTILPSNGISFSDARPVVQISGPGGPVNLSTVADAKGRFRFKRVLPGMYLLTAFIPRVARTKRTIEIGPSWADEKGRINIGVTLEPRPRRPERFQVQATQLSVPENARAEYDKGLRRLAKRDLAGASGFFREALDLAPHFSAASYQLGSIACQQGRFAEAVDHYRESLKYSPESYQILLSLGAALLASHNGPEALLVNQRAARSRPDDPEARAQAGMSYLAVDRLEEAEEHLKATIVLDPANFHLPQLLLAEIYRRRRDYSSMAHQLEEFLRLHPDSKQAGEVAKILAEVRSLAGKGAVADGPR